MCVHGVNGTFAMHCQRLFNTHRLPFFDAFSLAKWQVGSPATTTKTKLDKSGGVCEGKTRRFCEIDWWAWTWALGPARSSTTAGRLETAFS
jgi:hypothetical protein